jgi:uncharacterized MnhB-related membrane protein
MQELEATWGRVIAICWLIIWRGTLGAMILGGVLGFIIGFVGAILGFAQEATALSAIVGAIAGLAWYAFVVRMALRKHYKDFRIALVPR